jgi:hypothetical protein
MAASAGSSAADRGGAPCVRKQQRWEAVLRRERRPISLDRIFLQAFCYAICFWGNDAVAAVSLQSILRSDQYGKE